MRPRALVAAGILALCVAAIVVVLARYGLEQSLAWLAARRTLAAGPFIVFYAVAAIVLLPDSLVTIAAGVIFGLVRGLVLVSIGSMLGAAGAFFLGRSLARNWVRRRIRHWPKFHALDRAIARHGFWVVFLTRLSPLMPYGLLNYTYSVTAVRPRDYLLASWIGMLPGSLLYVYAGTAATNLAEVISGRVSLGREDSVMLWVGLAATITVIGLLTHFARRELARELRS